MGFQNFFAAKLYTDIGASDASITLDTAPTVTSGRMVLESRNPTQREIISYTGVSGNQLTGVVRGVGGTTAKPHLKNALIEMNVTAQDLQDLYDAFASFASSTTDWRVLVPVVTTVVHNGQRSYDITFNSSIANLFSPGARLQLTKTVAGNAYMGGAFNGTSHYFTKTSPTGTLSTVTNNFTIKSSYKGLSYPLSRAYLGGRSDATPNNGFGIFMEPSGQIGVIVFNGGLANLRSVTTVTSYPLEQTPDIVATWASGTVTISFDGVSQPLMTAVTTGTAPTVAGTGGDFSIGRLGSYGAYAGGYISNFAIFDTVLSAATIKQYATYKLTGAEANCIGAWSLDNTGVNQQAPGTNDLTAMNSVGFTAMSPHGQLGDGVQASKAIGLVMAVNGSTVTVQCPEGVTIPTTGGITSVSYATSGNPFGWVGNKGRWSVVSYHSVANVQNTPTSSVWYNIGNHQLYVPTGSWDVTIEGGGYCTDNVAALITLAVTLSKTNNTNDNSLFLATSSVNAAVGAAGNINLEMNFSRTSDITNVAPTTYYLNYSGNSTSAPLVDMQTRSNIIKALPSFPI